VTVVGNASVLQAVAPGSEPEHVSRLAGAQRPRLGVIGRLSPEKGVDVFLDAARRLCRSGIGFSASIIGDGPARESLVRRAEALDLGGRVTFFGSQPVAPATYRALDLLVIPSRSEGFPNVLLEALSEGCPVVATRVGAIPDIVGDSRAAILVPPGDPERLADGIGQALSPAPRLDMIEAGRRVARAWSVERRVADHVRLYRAVLAGVE
jgi:glycosyltransferase involved in cell wall biosynthesis